MGIPSSEIVQVVYALLPGFVTAWVFYALTAHPRLSPFERIVQALIFTGIIQAIVLLLREVAIWLGCIWCIADWTDASSFVISIIIAIIIGLLFALFSNKNWFHKWLRTGRWFRRFGGITTRTSFPSEWFSAFNEEQRYVVLHLGENRRLYGWPYEWPDHSESGHFVIMEPEWLLDDGKVTPLSTVHKILVPAKDVKYVEFMKWDLEIKGKLDTPSNCKDECHI